MFGIKLFEGVALNYQLNTIVFRLKLKVSPGRSFIKVTVTELVELLIATSWDILTSRQIRPDDLFW